MASQLQEAELLPELAEEFVNAPCHGVLFVHKQLKMSVCQLMPGLDKTDTCQWQNILEFHDVKSRTFQAATPFHAHMTSHFIPSACNDLGYVDRNRDNYIMRNSVQRLWRLDNRFLFQAEEPTGCSCYSASDHISCHGMSRWMQLLYATKLLC
jgi:hypothetical protein